MSAEATQTKRFLNVPEFAELLGVSKGTVYKLVENAGLPHICLGDKGRLIRFDLESESLRQWFASREN